MIVIQQLEDDQYRKDLIDKLGDEKYCMAAIEQLLHEYENGIFKYCVSWLDRDCGEEVAQEVFISAWNNLSNYRGESSIKTWLFGIAKNACRKFLRDRSRHREIMEKSVEDIRERAHGDEPITPENQQVSVEGQAEESQKKIRLSVCIKKLSDEEGHLVTWRYLKNKSVAEISDLLDEKSDTVYKRCKRVLKKLEECIKNESQR